MLAGGRVGLGGVVSFGKYTIITAYLKRGETAVKGGKISPSPPPRKYPAVIVQSRF